MRKATVPVLLSFVALATGCGDSPPTTAADLPAHAPTTAVEQSDAATPPDGGLTPTPGMAEGEPGVREVFTAWHAALAAGDGVYACSMMTGSAQRNIDQGFPPPCEQVIAQDTADYDEAERRALRSVQPNKVEIEGDEAHISRYELNLEIPNAKNLQFIRQDGRWLIDGIAS